MDIIARMNERILIEQSEVVVDAVGNHKNVWTPYYSCAAYAAAIIFKDTENEESGIIVSDETIVFTVRFCSEVDRLTTTGYRVIFKGTVYNIDSIDHMNYDRKTMKLRCKKEHRGDGNARGEGRRGGRWAGR